MLEFLEPLYTAEEMRVAEAGHDVEELMQRAGRAVGEEVLRRYPDVRRFALVAGNGANGGDGRIAAELLRAEGREVGDDGDVWIDALFGTGFHGEPRADAATTIERINASGKPVVALDVPSGVDASTGEVPGAAVRADLTVTFHGQKVGLAVAPGRFHAGEIHVADIGLEPQETALRLVSPEILATVPRKDERDNKYTAGSVLIVGGSPGLTGAICLAAEAAFRADAGYVAVAAPRESLRVLELRLLEAVKHPLEEIREAAKRARAVAIGPGLGRDRKQLVRELLAELDLPAVVDADGLRELEPFERSAGTVLTPHEGELGRLIGEEASWVAAHRLEALRRTVDRYRCVVVLKGADTLIGAPGEGVLVRSVNTPALATAGTGDVLTGIIAAFLAKGLDPRMAAAAGATAQGVAASLVSYQAGMVASDVIAALPRALG
jgi:ADP-dependent NAD(P)H-hydrate dehydratase / NAD(P)H-hydrate epimerase